MKRFAVIGIMVLVAIMVLTYFQVAGRSADIEKINEAASSEALAEDLSDAEPPVSSGKEKSDAAAQLIPEDQIRYSEKSGAKTSFELDLGEIGYVDVYSILQDRNPYSIVALVQNHRAYTGAGDVLELGIESTGGSPERYNARFVQVIDGAPTEARGSVSFDSSGLVHAIYGSLLDTQMVGTGNVVIAQAEAEAVAVEAARRFLESRRDEVAESGQPLKMEALPGELRYVTATDTGNALRAEWRVPVSIYGPPFIVQVLVDAKTGKVVSVKSLIETATVSAGRPGYRPALTVRQILRAVATTVLKKGDSNAPGGGAQPAVKRSQGCTAPQSHFHVGGVVHG